MFHPLPLLLLLFLGIVRVTICRYENLDLAAISSPAPTTAKDESKSMPEISNHSEQTQATTENQFGGRNNESDFSWIDDALKDIAYYLRAHKFNEYDRRYQTHAGLAAPEYFAAFPRPPLRSLHWEVHRFCEPSFLSCVEYLNRRIKGTGLRRSDDTAIVIQEQQWNTSLNAQQINIVDDECRKMLKEDNVNADPFQGPIERFQWRTTASYFMCWYTMNEVPDLQKFQEMCDNFSDCLDPIYGVHNLDPRAVDETPYSCALYSFCPDPCCPQKHLISLEECWESLDNPCFAGNPAGQRICTRNHSQNTDFADTILNRWNVTCKCPHAGFEWDSKYGMCVDIDECVGGWHDCDPDRQACVNLPGSFRCACRWGFSWDSYTGRCESSQALEIIELHNAKPENDKRDRKATSLVKKLYRLMRRNNACSRKIVNMLWFLCLAACIEF